MNETLPIQLDNSTSWTTWPTPLPPPIPSPVGPDYNEVDYLDLEFDDEPSIFLKLGAVIWLLFIVLCFKKERELEIEREARAERRRVRRAARRQARESRDRRLDPKRRGQDVEAAIITMVSQSKTEYFWK